MGTKAPPKNKSSQIKAVMAHKFWVNVTKADDNEPKNAAMHAM